MSGVSSKHILSVLREEIKAYQPNSEPRREGYVLSCGDGVATVYGLPEAMYGELVNFETGQAGMVLNLNEKDLGVLLLGDARDVKEGTKVTCTGEPVSVPVGDAMLGRVLDGLGRAIDGKGNIETAERRPVESKAPGVVTREEVNVPLQTGILAIDAMFPIGRGQRELIIGDRQTGKTSIAVDAMLNQKGQDVICIYVAIGQKASTVAKIVGTLERHGAMEYSIVISAAASDPAPLQYIAPYTGAALGEYFMDQGKDVLIVYDDLSKHAQAYRAISLLLHRPPGREAYPGDVFYLHSRLLERACRRNQEYGGGSMTALPIIETLAGDISAYIPTNVISITDGQIFLESGLFFAGQRPAVNVGLSVSRVGGKAQTKAMKTVAGTIRVDLAQYREMEAFAQFGSDLDESTKALLDYGVSLYALLRQPLYHPMPLEKQVVLLSAARRKLLMDVPPSRLEAFKDELMDYMARTAPQILEGIRETKKLDEDGEAAIAQAVNDFKAGWLHE